MSNLQRLRVFVSERLAAAAEEILGAVERTIIEYENEIYFTKRDIKHGGLLVDGLKREETEELRAVSQEVTLFEVKASAMQKHGEERNPDLNQDTRTPPLHKPEGELQDLVQGDAASSIYNMCSEYDQSSQSSPYCQTQNVGRRDGNHLSGASAEWMKTEDDRVPEAAGDWKPLSSDCGEESEDRSDAEWMDSGGSGLKTSESKTRTKQRQKRTAVGAKRRESMELLKSLWPNHGPFCCKACGESFHSRSYLMRHVKSHADNMAHFSAQNQAAPTENRTKCLKAPREDNLCEVCGKTFTQKSHLKRHMVVHTGQKPYCCKECGKRFTRSESLRIHMRMHTVERPYACDACGKRFSQKGNMSCHMRTHTGEKPHRCGICCRAFAHSKDMSRHMKIHSGKR